MTGRFKTGLPGAYADKAEDGKRNLERLAQLKSEARSIRDLLRTHLKRTGDGGNGERKSNLTDNDSTKMATGKGVIQGYTGAATVDAACQIIMAAQAHGSGSEQSLQLPMIEQAMPYADEQTVMTADAGYHSEANLKQLHERGIAALIADGLMRRRDERFKDQARHKAKPDPLANKVPVIPAPTAAKFRPHDFDYDPVSQTCICPAGKTLYSNGTNCKVNDRTYRKFTGAKQDCVPSKLWQQCLRTPDKTAIRQVGFFSKAQALPLKYTEAMKQRASIPLRGTSCTAGVWPRWNRCSTTCATTRDWTGSRCAASARWIRNGNCTAWCTTSKSWPIMDMRNEVPWRYTTSY